MCGQKRVPKLQHCNHIYFLSSSHEVQTLASQLLYSPRQIEMPIPEHSFDLDLYPRFTEMMSYVQKKQEQRVADKKTVTRGSLVMAFRHDSIKAVSMFQY